MTGGERRGGKKARDETDGTRRDDIRFFAALAKNFSYSNEHMSEVTEELWGYDNITKNEKRAIRRSDGFSTTVRSLYLKVKLETQQVLVIIPYYTGK